MDTIFILHAAVTWAMVGLIWTVQIVVYPALADVPAESFPRYEGNHQRRMTLALAVLAPLELVTALWVFLTPGDVPQWIPLVAGIVLAALWLATGLFYAPLHGRLARGRDIELIRLLVRTNWGRTAGWTVRGLLAAAILALAG